MAKPDYDTTVARIAGNILSGMQADPYWKQHPDGAVIAIAVDWARQIVAEVKRTEPDPKGRIV